MSAVQAGLRELWPSPLIAVAKRWNDPLALLRHAITLLYSGHSPGPERRTRDEMPYLSFTPGGHSHYVVDQ